MEGGEGEAGREDGARKSQKKVASAELMTWRPSGVTNSWETGSECPMNT